MASIFLYVRISPDPRPSPNPTQGNGSRTGPWYTTGGPRSTPKGPVPRRTEVPGGVLHRVGRRKHFRSGCVPRPEDLPCYRQVVTIV